MAINIFSKIFGNPHERTIKRMGGMVTQINTLEPTYQAMSDEELAAQTGLLKSRHAAGETLEDLLPEAFAVTREASWRVLEMRHFDCQLIGGIALHQGGIAEMKTGEGKTLVATLPAYLNAISGKGVHVVTVNDYLAKRDSEWMGRLYNFLGLSFGNVVSGMDDAQRKEAYNSDITYGTNNEFGFDYLRDNMKFEADNLVQRDLNFAIVDEVDSILIDEARTPLIISGPAEKSTSMYYDVDAIIPFFKNEEHYSLDEKGRSATLTDEGVALAEQKLAVDNLYDPRHIETLHHVNQALKAHTLFKRDVDYIVKDQEVIIVDEFTGRLMPGRRYSEGLHQALEAKEKVTIENENQTLASITFQNYFRMYKKLAGMTGTAETEADEFMKIYNLGVLVVPTNKPMVRKDHADVIYKTRREKFDAAIAEIIERNKTGQPVLVGTVSIDVSEDFSRKLKKRGIKHEVLNAKQHEQEAQIVAAAGQKGAVTISTNMAGRGTDIVLGDGVTDLGGLHIIGTERHESRRIDNQLRGRSGRQGDPGSSRFYLSLEDDLLRIFGGDRITAIMERMGMEDGEPIEHRLISRAIENAQKKVEGHNFDIRKHILEYDDVMNQQREVIYRQRRMLLQNDNLREFVLNMIGERAFNIAELYAQEKVAPADWDLEGLSEAVHKQFNVAAPMTPESLINMDTEALENYIRDIGIREYEQKEAQMGTDMMRELERFFILQTLDSHWKDHLLSMDHLKEGIGLRGYAQQNPLLVYKKEGYDMFEHTVSRVQEEALEILYRVQIMEEEVGSLKQEETSQDLTFSSHAGEDEKKQTVRRDADKIGRNDVCPCGSGKKFKKCCGQ